MVKKNQEEIKTYIFERNIFLKIKLVALSSSMYADMWLI
jgi:hypothetical protein